MARRPIVLSLLTASLLGAAGRPAAATGGEYIAVIVHPKNPVGSLSLAELRHLFLKQSRRWPDGKAVLVINHKARSATRVAFDRAVLKMSPDQAATYWIKQRVRGRGHPPRSFRSSSIIVRIVAKQREAVAYVPVSTLVTAGVKAKKVKVIKIDGRLPGGRHYPIYERERK